MNREIIERAIDNANRSCAINILFGLITYIEDGDLDKTEDGEYIKQILRNVIHYI